MRLELIKGPADLQALDPEELDGLCSQIRSRIVESVNTHGGHMGPNLGVVELTVALHRVFNSPKDVILWDTGHQAYVHKMLTGRLADFDTLRQGDGLSGYPSRSESEHDWIENSHASTSLCYAHGLATAFTAADAGRRVVAVIGDGAMTGGMAFEGLNNLGRSHSDVVILLNDNGRSYAPTASKLSESLMKIRLSPAYMRRAARLEEIAERTPWVGEMIQRGVKMSDAAVVELSESKLSESLMKIRSSPAYMRRAARLEEIAERTPWVGEMIQRGVKMSDAAVVELSDTADTAGFFEDLGVRYQGPYDGHNIAKLEEVLRNASDIGGPVLVHALTMKGRGYEPAESDSVKHMHDTGSVRAGSYTAMFSDTLLKLGEAHPELVAITAAMPDSTGLLAFGERFGDRCIDVGIAEQHAVAAATGMAMGGLRPVVAVYSTFLSRAFDQVNLDCGLHGAPVIFCLDRAGITGDDGPSHHGILDMVLLTKVPNMKVLAPSSLQELEQMMNDAMGMTDGPVAIRWPKTEARTVGDDQVGSGLNGRRARQGDGSVCLIGVGKMLEACEQAAVRLAEDGIQATVWDPRAVRPLCEEMLADADRHDLVVTVEDGLRDGGAGAGIRDALGEPDVVVLGVPTDYLPHGNPADILARLGLDAEGIAATTRSELLLEPSE